MAVYVSRCECVVRGMRCGERERRSGCGCGTLLELASGCVDGVQVGDVDVVDGKVVGVTAGLCCVAVGCRGKCQQSVVACFPMQRLRRGMRPARPVIGDRKGAKGSASYSPLCGFVDAGFLRLRRAESGERGEMNLAKRQSGERCSAKVLRRV